MAKITRSCYDGVIYLVISNSSRSSYRVQFKQNLGTGIRGLESQGKEMVLKTKARLNHSVFRGWSVYVSNDCEVKTEERVKNCDGVRKEGDALVKIQLRLFLPPKTKDSQNQESGRVHKLRTRKIAP